MRAYLALIALSLGCGAAASSTPTRALVRATEASPQAPTELSPAQLARQSALSTQLAPILAAYESYGAVLSPDGSRALFRSDRGGASELFLAELAHRDAPAVRIVSGPERVASASFTRDGRAALFRRDRGHDETFHIFRVELDGSGLTDLTPTEGLWRDHPLLPAARPDVMVYSSRTATDLRSSIVVQSIRAEAPGRVVYTDESPAAVVDVLADASRALMIRERVTGRELIEVDLATGAARVLAPTDGRAATVRAAAYSADGERAFVAIDHGDAEGFALIAVERASLRELARLTAASLGGTTISSIVVSPRGDRLAIDLGAGDHSGVRILDARTLASLAEVQTPLGSVSVGLWTEIVIGLNVGAFSDDGARFVIGLSRPDRPGDVYVVDASSGALAPLRDEARPGLDELAPMRASVERIPSFDGAPIPASVYLPERPDRERALPVIVWLHGGPDQHSEIGWNVFARAFTRLGFAFIEPNIRGSTGFGRAWEIADDRERRVDALRDIESLARWASAQAWCDRERMVVAGASFGGTYALLALERQPELWRAGIDVAGVSDLRALLESPAAPTRYRGELGDIHTELALIDAFDPLPALDAIRAPLFVYHGHNDGRVPRGHADAVVATLRARGAPVEYMLATDEGHTLAAADVLPRIVRFLEEALAR